MIQSIKHLESHTSANQGDLFEINFNPLLEDNSQPLFWPESLISGFLPLMSTRDNDFKLPLSIK